MNQKQITDEVKRLAKEIAKLWRMELYEGCWVQVAIESDAHQDRLLMFNPEKMFIDGKMLRFSNGYYYDEWFPIPDIGDCERKLLRLGFTYRTDRLLSCVVIQLYDPEDEGKPYGKEMQGVNTHEALLSTLLEVLKEQKSGVGEEKEGKSE